jgi:glutathione S-transferase
MSEPRVKLVGRNLSPYTRRCAIVMQQLNVPHERVILSTYGEDQAKLFRYNPLGRVPALVLEDGETLIESAAILDYLLQQHDRTGRLLPAHGKQRRDCLGIIALATGAMDKGVSAIYEVRRRPPEKVHQPWLDHLIVQARGGLQALEAKKHTPWLQGAEMNLADISVAVAVTFLRTLCPDVAPPGAYRQLEGLTARAEATPAFAACPLETH